MQGILNKRIVKYPIAPIAKAKNNVDFVLKLIKMKKNIYLLILIANVFGACNIFSPYGKKVTINPTLEVYIKGDSTTEADAKKLGNFLAETWKESTNQKSFQLIKENGGYTVKMVVDEEKVKADSTLELSFLTIKMLLETEVFKGSRVKFVLTNNKFKAIKTYDAEPAKTSTVEPTVSKDSITK